MVGRGGGGADVVVIRASYIKKVHYTIYTYVCLIETYVLYFTIAAADYREALDGSRKKCL